MGGASCGRDEQVVSAAWTTCLPHCDQKLGVFESDISVIRNDWNRGEDVVHEGLAVGLGLLRSEFDTYDQFGDCDRSNCHVVSCRGARPPASVVVFVILLPTLVDLDPHQLGELDEPLGQLVSLSRFV